MDPNLTEAARVGNIDGLYEAIKKNPAVLKEIDEIPFVNTPLHEAASAGQTNFAIEMMSLAPSFGRKLNPDGLSPLDLALLNNHCDTLKRLVKVDGELVRVKGKERMTPLHRAAESDDKIGCMIELLVACPNSIEDLTIRDETALHIAMKKSSAEAFKILYEWVRRSCDEQLLRKKDAEGNSAKAYHNEQPQHSLQGVQAEVPSSLADADADTKNLYNYLRTPEPFNGSLIRKLLIYMIWSQRDLTMEMRNVVLIVAVLIATASLQAVLSPPGGSENYNKNSSAKPFDNQNFYLMNTMAFNASVGVIIVVLQLKTYTTALHVSLIFMAACYWSSLKLVLSPIMSTCYIIGSFVYIFWISYFKVLLSSIEHNLLDLPLLPPRWKQSFRFLHQMGAFTFK